MRPKTIKRGPGKQRLDAKSFRLADEVRYIQNKAARRDGRIVSLRELILFSTETGDAWLLDTTDQLATRLARDGARQPIQLEENDTSFAILWKGHYSIDGPAFIYMDGETGRVTTIIGYPTEAITRAVASIVASTER